MCFRSPPSPPRYSLPTSLVFLRRDIWLDDVDCSSSDTTLLSCNHRGIGRHNCGHSEDVAVRCSQSASSKFNLSLSKYGTKVYVHMHACMHARTHTHTYSKCSWCSEWCGYLIGHTCGHIHPGLCRVPLHQQQQEKWSHEETSSRHNQARPQACSQCRDHFHN